jgi:acyl-CoA dehydrogenase
MNSSHAGELQVLIRELVEHASRGTPDTPADLWSTLVDLGLSRIGIDEAAGGSGGSFGDLVAVAFSLGREGVSTPLIDSWAAASVLADHGIPTGSLPIAVVGEPGADAHSAEFTVRVPWGRECTTLVIVSPDDRAWWVPAQQLAWAADTHNVASEPRAEAVVQLQDLRTLSPLTPLSAAIGTLWSAAVTGASTAAYDMTRQYVGERVQFGQPLIRIPAIQSNLARMKAAVIQSACAVDRAVEQFGEQDAVHSALTARVLSSRGATEVIRQAHQLHGAMGITQEYGLARLTMRASTWRDMGISETEAARRLGEQARMGGEQRLWEELTA